MIWGIKMFLPYTLVGMIETVLRAGDSYVIPGGVPHSFEVVEGGEVVDVFTPQRENYL